MDINVLRPVTRRLGVIMALAVTFAGLLASPASAGSPSLANAAAGDDGSGGARWVMIVIGLLIGVGIGMVIVFRARRKHPRDNGSVDGGD